MQTTHQAKIDGHGSLNFSRVPSGLIEVNLTAPDGGPKHNSSLTHAGKLKDERVIASLSPEGVDDLIDYLQQFVSRHAVQVNMVDRMAAKNLRRVVTSQVGASSVEELDGVLKNLEMAIDIPEEVKSKIRATVELLKSTVQYAD